MGIFETIRKKHEDRLIAKVELIKAQRQAEQKKVEEEKRIEQEQLRIEQEKLEAERKIQEEQRKEKLKREEEKILAMTAPLDYIVELESKYTKRIKDKEYTYIRNDCFLCDTPRKELLYPYTQYKFIKISGEDIGEVFTSSEDDEIKFTDLHGHEYTKDSTINNLFLISTFRHYTIKELNDYLEKVNEKLEEIAVRNKRNTDNDKEVMDSIFNL